MITPPDPSTQPHNDADNHADKDVDGCDVDFADAEQTSDEDLPVAVGGEA